MIDDPAPITDHLAELRRRIFRILLAVTVLSIVSFSYAEEIFLFLVEPVVQSAEGTGTTLQAISPTETFFTYLKCALLAGFVLSLPVTFWQVWAFIAPGLYESERRAVIPFVFISSLLFMSGAIFGYTQVFPLVFDFLSGFDDSPLIQQNWTMSAVFSTTSRLFLAFGTAFELPVVVFFLAITGLVSTRKLISGTPYALLAIFVVAAILTPPDPMSQVLLALPMFVLYILGVGVSWIFDPARKRKEIQESQDE
ncbi:MAG: twin-arginine translocase subunit TatC [Myxococcota bacterium]|nr:twin-arginine translocase subunit TatC [Spirochaeta sp.]RPG09381.1 MAG: twin-arginine translocase subunit TatC [Proteobacteria bacterium TMED72]